MFWTRLIKAGVALAVAVGLAGASPAAEHLEVRNLRGQIGPYPIGLQLRYAEDANDLIGGHYFYLKHLSDIPLQGRVEGDQLILNGQDGGVFRLKLGERRGGASKLDPPDSLAGVWTRGGQTLPVRLETSSSGTWKAGSQYWQVTTATDAAFEAMVRRFADAVVRGDRAAAADLVAYPLRVNYGPGKHRWIRNKAEFNAQWSRTFTPDTVKKIKAGVPHDMFVRREEVMLGDGVVWFRANGVTAINTH